MQENNSIKRKKETQQAESITNCVVIKLKKKTKFKLKQKRNNFEKDLAKSKGLCDKEGNVEETLNFHQKIIRNMLKLYLYIIVRFFVFSVSHLGVRTSTNLVLHNSLSSL